MSAPRTLLRSTRAVRSRPIRQINQCRTQHTAPSSGTASSGGSATQSAIYGGVAGGSLAFLLGYAWYSVSGTKKVVQTVHQAKDYFESAKQKATESAPEPNEALKWLRQQASFYAAFVPGGANVVNSTFDDIDMIHDKHRDEVDKIVKEAYDELRDVSNKSLSVSTANEASVILSKHLKRIMSLAGDSAKDLLNNHPQLQSKLGPQITQLRNLGSDLGPEATKFVNETWDQVSDIVRSSGMSSATIPKVQKLLQEKTQQLKELSNKAWDKGMQEAKPYLEKTPKVKEVLESNKDSLLSSNLGELWQKVKQASQSGNTQDLEQYVKQAGHTAGDKSSSAMGLASAAGGSLLSMIPGGSELTPKLQQIQEISQTHSKEAEQLVKDTIKEIQDVLSKKLEEGKKLADSAKSEAKE